MGEGAGAVHRRQEGLGESGIGGGLSERTGWESCQHSVEGSDGDTHQFTAIGENDEGGILGGDRHGGVALDECHALGVTVLGILLRAKVRIGLDAALKTGLRLLGRLRLLRRLGRSECLSFALLFGTFKEFGSRRTVLRKGDTKVRSGWGECLHFLAILCHSFKALGGFLEESLVHHLLHDGFAPCRLFALEILGKVFGAGKKDFTVQLRQGFHTVFVGLIDFTEVMTEGFLQTSFLSVIQGTTLFHVLFQNGVQGLCISVTEEDLGRNSCRHCASCRRLRL